MSKKQQHIRFNNLHWVVAVFVVGLSCLGLAVGLSPSAEAATLNSLYSYDLRNVSGTTVANAAAANTAVPLNLVGNWTSTPPSGVYFTGNLVDQQSVGWAKPTTGATLNLAATVALAFGTQFTYQAPTSGTCFSDSENITQVGRFANLATQAKLQLSNCGKSSTAVFVQCRIAGNSTSSTVLPVTSTLPLENGMSYVSTCTKSTNGAGSTVIDLNVTKLDPVNGNQTVANSFTQPATGIMNTSLYLSVANKYQLAAQSANTDQFVGTVTKVAYCKGSTVVAANTCLTAELPR